MAQELSKCSIGTYGDLVVKFSDHVKLNVEERRTIIRLLKPIGSVSHYRHRENEIRVTDPMSLSQNAIEKLDEQIYRILEIRYTTKPLRPPSF